MRNKILVLGGLIIGLLMVSGPAFAHHAWTGYDMAKLTSVKGTVSEFDWANPHVWIKFNVTDDKGAIEKWSAGGPSLIRMSNTGWNKDTIKPGDQIIVTGNRIKDGSNTMRLTKVMLADGRELLCYGTR